MSHQPERTEKNCLNCGTTVAGRYCQHCGQENIVTHQNFWSLTRHFIFDIFHFDGKFFDTLKYLFTRPGFVPREYVSGRRQSYLDPIRMYLFTSAVFFLFFFSFNRIGEINNEGRRHLSKSERFDLAARAGGDTALRNIAPRLLDTNYQIQVTPVGHQKADPKGLLVNFPDGAYRLTVDSAYRPRVKSSINWLGRRMEEDMKKAGDESRFWRSFLDEFLHRLPYMLFVSLPIFAWLLKLLYRRRKEFVYSDHAVYTLYHYIFSFILMLLVLFFSEASDAWGWAIFDILNLIITLVVAPVYFWISLRRFYRQSWKKTTAKFLLLNIMAGFVLLLLFALFFGISLLY